MLLGVCALYYHHAVSKHKCKILGKLSSIDSILFGIVRQLKRKKKQVRLRVSLKMRTYWMLRYYGAWKWLFHMIALNHVMIFYLIWQDIFWSLSSSKILPRYDKKADTLCYAEFLQNSGRPRFMVWMCFHFIRCLLLKVQILRCKFVKWMPVPNIEMKEKIAETRYYDSKFMRRPNLQNLFDCLQELMNDFDKI